MKSTAQRAALTLLPVLLVAGVAIGLLIRPTVDRLVAPQSVAAEEEASPDKHEEEEEGEHIALTKQAYQNLNLSVEAVRLSDYTSVQRMPGEIIESPGLSMQKVAAPVSGRVSRLFTYPGISVSEGVPLCEIQIIDDHLEEAQLRFLELLTKREIVDAELERLAPLASSGSVAGRKQLEWEYQKKELDSSLSRTRQELVIRGLSQQQVEAIVETRRAISSLTVVAPKSVSADLRSPGGQWRFTSAATQPQQQDQTDLTVEELFVESGQNLTRGEPICSLAAHDLLSVCGHAFENEIETVSRLAADRGAVTLEYGIGEQTALRKGLRVQYVDSHVDQATQSFRFYVPLPNDLVTESTDSLGRRFRTWKYKVGQRVHVLVPAQEIRQQIVAPRDAVVREGPDFFVFREHVEQETEPTAAEPPVEDAHEEVFIEFEPVPVTVVYEDRSVVVIAPHEELAVGERIAMSSGYQLLLALKHQQGGGGHGHHHH